MTIIGQLVLEHIVVVSLVLYIDDSKWKPYGSVHPTNCANSIETTVASVQNCQLNCFGAEHTVKCPLLHYMRLIPFLISLVSTPSRSEKVDEFLKSKCDTTIMEYL